MTEDPRRTLVPTAPWVSSVWPCEAGSRCRQSPVSYLPSVAHCAEPWAAQLKVGCWVSHREHRQTRSLLSRREGKTLVKFHHSKTRQ